MVNKGRYPTSAKIPKACRERYHVSELRYASQIAAKRNVTIALSEPPNE